MGRKKEEEKEEEGEEKCVEMFPIQSQAMWAQTGWGRELSAGGSGEGESERGLWV